MKKAVFFDIDGTLFQQGNAVPKSTIVAIEKIRKNGHYAFVCSGRSRVMIPQTPILDIGFDGVLAACGMYGSFHDELVFHTEMDESIMESIIPILHDTHTMYILEGTKDIYYDGDTIKYAQDDWYISMIRKIVPRNFIEIPPSIADIHACKISLLMPKDYRKQITSAAEKNFQLLMHTEDIGELVPNGFSKAVGIAHMCEILGVDQKDTIAVGDSINDLDMLDYAGCGIVMGNGTPIAKEHADFITKDINDDGIYFAMEQMGLL